MQVLSISNYFVRRVLHHAQARGMDVTKLLQRAGIPPRLYADRESRVTAEQFAALQAVVATELQDEMFGYCEKPVRPGSWSAFCHWALLAPNLGVALKRFCRFNALFESGLKSVLSVDGECVRIGFGPWNPASVLNPYAYEFVIYALHRLACWLVEENLAIEVVNLAYPEPEHSEVYRWLFPGGLSRFNQTNTEMVLERRVLDLPIRQTPETLAVFLRRQALNMLVNDYHQQAWAARTRAVLKARLENLPTLVEVAAELDIHPKKLRRHLDEEGVVYSDLKSQLRCDMAIRYLTRTHASIEEIASRIGYSETCTFTRAFKQWTGVAPYTYRKESKR